MKNQEFRNQVQQSAEIHKELNQRLNFSAEIIRNLWLKHFHNFDVKIADVFPWISNRQFQFEENRIYIENPNKRNAPLNWRDKRLAINPIYYSNNVREIAKQARKDFYAGAHRNMLDAKNKSQNQKDQAQREFNAAERKLKNSTEDFNQQNKRVHTFENFLKERNRKKR